jgi:hypothetical protein
MADYMIDMVSPKSELHCQPDDRIFWQNPSGNTLTAIPTAPNGWPWGGNASIPVDAGGTNGPYPCNDLGTYPYRIPPNEHETNPTIVVDANL